MSERYVVKLASGEYVTWHGEHVSRMVEVVKMSRRDAYRLALEFGAVALRLKPSKRAAELDKLKAEVEALKVELTDARQVRDRKWEEAKAAIAQLDSVEAQLRGAREHRIRAEGERDALAAQLAALPPDISDEALAREVKVASSLDGPWSVHAARIARHLLRGPVAPARPVDELREELRGTFYETIGNAHDCWVAVAKRARELGAR